MYGGATAPTGWLLCDGSTVGRNAYPGLFNAVSTLYGSGDGSTTFTLPDMRGRMPVGKGTHADVSTLGNNDGVVVANRRSKHKHTVASLTATQPSHNHSGVAPGGGSNDVGQADGAGGFGGPVMGALTNESGWTTGSSQPSITTGGFVGNSTDDSVDAPAYLVINYIIKT